MSLELLFKRIEAKIVEECLSHRRGFSSIPREGYWCLFSLENSVKTTELKIGVPGMCKKRAGNWISRAGAAPV